MRVALKSEDLVPPEQRVRPALNCMISEIAILLQVQGLPADYRNVPIVEALHLRASAPAQDSSTVPVLVLQSPAIFDTNQATGDDFDNAVAALAVVRETKAVFLTCRNSADVLRLMMSSSHGRRQRQSHLYQARVITSPQATRTIVTIMTCRGLLRMM